METLSIFLWSWTDILWPSNATPTIYQEKWKCVYINTCTNVYINFIQDSQNLEASQIFINRRMNKQIIYVHTHAYSYSEILNNKN